MNKLFPKEKNVIRYLELSPEEKSGEYSLIIYLHGAGERGDDLQKINVHGPIKEVMSKKVRLDNCIILAPQCDIEKTWWDYAERLYNLILWYKEQPFIDKERIYLTGNSMGGYGTWALSMAHPELFAAIVPICGGGMTWNVQTLKNMPVWATHCVGDDVVPCHTTISMIEKLKKISLQEVRLTIYPYSSHDAWTETYQNQEMYDWLFSKKLGK